ncbi:hypothetical protein R6Q57_001401 [Mikania cordata]
MYAVRSISTTAGDYPRLLRFALHTPNHVEVEFANGSLYRLSAEYLRVFSPAVDSKIRSIGVEKELTKGFNSFVLPYVYWCYRHQP